MLFNTTLLSSGELGIFTLLPYLASYLFIKYGLLTILTILGFGSAGILLDSIASWIQSKYGTSYLFSLLQSIGARGGILHPKFWSGITGTTYNLVTSWTNSQSGHYSFIATNKSKQTQGDFTFRTICLPVLFFGAFISICVIGYFSWRQNNSPPITTTRTVRVNRPMHQYWQRLRNTLVLLHTRNRSSPLKVTEILHRNPSGDYSCPGCRKIFKAQGITNHVKSCAKEWCTTNGIRITGTE